MAASTLVASAAQSAHGSSPTTTQLPTRTSVGGRSAANARSPVDVPIPRSRAT